jgi:5'-methylthioadenosine phosphorylase
MVAEAAIIGGTGVGERLAAMPGRTIHIPTSEGQLAGKELEHNGRKILLVNRHSVGHKVPPHKVNYRAIALGLKKAGVRVCISTAAVGSLRREWGPGTMVAVSDFVDLTGRFQTLFDRSVVHTDFSDSVSPLVIQSILQGAKELALPIKPSGVYVCGNGPRYETPYEITLYSKIGDLVGMTAATEAILLREAGIAYGCLATVTNLAAGMDKVVLEHEDVVRQMRNSADASVKLVLRAIELYLGAA